VEPIIANTECGYSPRCSTPGSGGVVRISPLQLVSFHNRSAYLSSQPNPAASYIGPQPGTLTAKTGTKSMKVNRQVSPPPNLYIYQILSKTNSGTVASSTRTVDVVPRVKIVQWQNSTWILGISGRLKHTTYLIFRYVRPLIVTVGSS